MIVLAMEAEDQALSSSSNCLGGVKTRINGYAKKMIRIERVDEQTEIFEI